METFLGLNGLCTSLFLVLIITVTHTDAQQNKPSIRKIYVPADTPESWPEGNWTPVPSSRLAEQTRRQVTSPSSKAWMKEGRYQATLNKDVLQNGRFELEVAEPEGRTNGTTLISWQNTNLAFSNLNWKNQPAKLGNKVDGNLFLMVPHNVKFLSGQWSIQGRHLEGGVFFDLQFPQSAVTELELLLPKDDRIVVFDNTPISFSPASRPQEQRVILSLGAKAHARFFVSFGNSNSQSAPTSQLFTRTETLLSLSRDQSRFRQELLIESLGAEVKTILIPVPDKLSIRSIEFGGIPLNSWSVSRNQPRTLSVSFPNPILGLSRPLRISGTIEYTEGELWRVPRLLPENSFSLSELITLNVSPPLELLAIEREGFLQTAATTNANGAGSLVFQRNSPTGEIDVRLGLPPTRFETQIVTRLKVSDQYWVADVELLGQVSSGRLYSIWMDLASEWEPKTIEFHNQTSMRVSPVLPSTIDRSNGRKILRVELPVAISRAQPLNLRMTFRGSRSGAKPPVVPVVRMTGEIPSVQALIVDRELTSPENTLSRLTGWRQLSSVEFPSWVTSSGLGAQLSDAAHRRQVFLSTKPGVSSLPLPTPLAKRSVGVIDELTISEDELGRPTLSEQIEILLPVNVNELKSLLLETSSDVNLQSLQWSIRDSTKHRVTCLPLTPPDGSPQTRIKEWQLNIEPAISSLETLIGSRQIPFDNKIQAILPIPQFGTEISGRVELFDRRDSAHQKILITQATALNQTFPDHWISEYESSQSRLDFRLEQDKPKPLAQRVMLSLETRLASASSQQLSHRLKWPIAAGQDRLAFTIPESMSDYSASVDGQLISGTVNGSGKTIFQFKQHQNPEFFELVYRSEVIWERGHFLSDIPLPQSDEFQGRISWNLNLPPDCHINQYDDRFTLRTTQPSLHWTQRFFGPLGRESNRKFFNPLDFQKLSSVFGVSPEPQEMPLFASELNLNFESHNLPSIVQIKGWSQTRQSQLAWVLVSATLLIGISLRLTRWEGRTASAAWIVSVVIISCCLVPGDWAIFTGAICAGVLITIFFPRVFLLGRRRLDGNRLNSLPDPEGTTLRKVLIGAMLLSFTSVFWSVGDAQSRTNQTPEVIDLLIPYIGDQPADELPELIYVRNSQRQSTIFNDQSILREVLFSQASYQCRLTSEGPANLKALFQLELPSSQAIDSVTIPLTGANLARDNGCLVDGQPVSVTIGPSGALEIPLPEKSFESPLRAPRPGDEKLRQVEEFRTISIELNLYASINIQQSIKQFELGIPAIDNSSFRCESAEGLTIAEFKGARGAVTKLDARTFDAQLGMSRTLALSWYSQSTNGPDLTQSLPSHLELDQQIAIEAFPTHLNYRFRVVHELKSGNLSTIRWVVPNNFHFRKATSAGVLQVRTFLENGQRVLLFDLENSLDPSSPSFLIDAEFVVPVSREDEDEIRVPVPQLHTHNIENATFSDVQKTHTVVGIWSPPELPLTILELPTQGLQTLSADNFLSRWPEDASLQKPLFSYEITGAATLSFLKSESQSQKQVWGKETGLVGERFLEWDWNGEIQTSVLPAFEHVFLVDPRLDILSVSVKEDQAERLNRWSREGRRLTLRLTRKVEESSQEVSIRTRLPLGDEENVQSGEETLELPEIRLLGGNHVESIAELYLAPTRSARWRDQVDPPSLESSTDSFSDSEESVFFDLINRRNDSSNPEVLLIGKKNIPPVIKRHLTCTQRADGDFDVECSMVEIQTESTSETLDVLIPADWVPRFRISSDSTGIEKKITEDGLLKLTIPSELRFVPLIFQSTLVSPEVDLWQMPWPFVENEAVYQNQVSLRLSDGWAPRQECRLQATPDSNSFDRTNTYDSWEYLCDDLELQRTELSDPEAVPTIPLLITRVDVSTGKPLKGQWWLVYRGRGRNQLQLKISPSIEVNAVDRENQPVVFERDAENGMLSLNLDAAGTWQSFLIDWESTKPPEPRIFWEHNIPTPTFNGVQVRNERIIMVAGEQLKMTMHNGLSPVSQHEFRLSLLESFLRMLKDQEDALQGLPSEVEWLLNSLLRDTTTHLDTKMVDVNQMQSFQRRYEKIREEFLAILPEDYFEKISEGVSELSIEPELLWSDLMPGVIPATDIPDRQIIYALSPPQKAQEKVWWLSRSWYQFAIAIVGAIIGIPALLWIFRENMADWLALNRVYAWMAIGLIWWTGWELSIIGLLIFATAIIAWMCQWIWSRPRRT